MEDILVLVGELLESCGNDPRALFAQLLGLEERGWISLPTWLVSGVESLQGGEGVVEYWCDGCADGGGQGHWKILDLGVLGTCLARQVVSYCLGPGEAPDAVCLVRVRD